MSEPKLKHCPRCEDSESALKQVLQDVDLMVLRECRACGLRSPNFKTGAEADSWWNERPAEQPEPTRNAAEPPPHQCPYGGHGVNYHWAGDDHYPGDSANRHKEYDQQCGRDGWLCDRCKEDRADARAGVGNRLLAVEEYATATDA